MSCFMRSKKHPELGIGKFYALHGEQVEIEYFDSPISMERETRIVDYSDADPVILASETRVYFLDRESGFWRVGRIADHMDDICHVSTPNKQLESLPENDVYTRWDLPIEDPSEHLAARLTETAYFHDSRSMLLESFVEQRAACSGFSALMSSPVSLERHQVEVIRRVLEDPIQRYFLADEVGLGKTIEAGIILRQYILDYPDDHSALIVVPEALVGQWKEELHNRCQIGRGFGHNIDFVSLETLSEDASFLDTIEVDFVIIDEAHQAVVGWDDPSGSKLKSRFEALSNFCNPARTARLLLLSATPVRRNEDGFLALLHLLDPAVYDVSQREVFRQKVEQRQELANIFHTFTEDEDSYFLEEMVDDLTDLFPSDTRLLLLLNGLRPFLDLSVDKASPDRCLAIQAVRVHLSETYRLHRRLLRNRRCEEVEGILPGRAGLTSVGYEDELLPIVEDRIESWRLGASAAIFGEEDSVWAQRLKQLFGLFLDLAYCDVYALSHVISIRLNRETSYSGEWGILFNDSDRQLVEDTELFPEEQDLLKPILEAICSFDDAYEMRFDAIDDLVRDRLKDGFRVIVFATSPRLADELFSYLEDLHNDPVFRHSSSESSSCDFRDLNGKGILVCDYRAEEGLNLQGGDACILHADLPLSPNRIEQRMGRLDRFGSGSQVVSLTLVPNECVYHRVWHDCVNDTYQIFSRSIAALQYVVEDETKTMMDLLLTEGAQSIEDSKLRLGGESGALNLELKDILNQDELDAIGVRDLSEEVDLTDQIEAFEEGQGEFQRIFEGWVVNRLQFVRVGGSQSGDRIVRYRYVSSDHRRATLVSANDFISWFEPAIQRGTEHSHSTGPMTFRMSFFRETSRCRNVGLARIGNPLIDCVHNYLRWDDRGTSFAFWRHSNLIPVDEVRVYFRYDFLVELGDESINALLEENPHFHYNEIKRRGDSVFPPLIRSIWIGEDMTVAEGDLLDELTPEYLKGCRDKNLNATRWKVVEDQPFFSLDDWPDMCRMACDSAKKSLISEIDLKELILASVRKQEIQNSVVRAQFESRIDALHHNSFSDVECRHSEQELQDEMIICDALLDGTKSPRLRLDAAGVVFLAGRPFPQ